MHTSLLLIPLLSALGGACIVWILRRLLFYPLTPKKIVGISFQGLLPKNQTAIAATVAAMLKKELLSGDMFNNMVASPDNYKKILPQIEQHIDGFLKIKLPASMPMIGMLIGDKTIQQLKSIFMAELETLFPIVMTGYIQSIQSDNNFEKMVTDKLASVNPATFAVMAAEQLRKPLRKMMALGAVVGILVGWLELAIYLLLIH